MNDNSRTIVGLDVHKETIVGVTAVRGTNTLRSSFPNDFIGNPVLMLDSGQRHAGMTGGWGISVDVLPDSSAWGFRYFPTGLSIKDFS